MSKFTLSKMRPYSHWLVFTVSFLILATTISLTLLWPPGSVALDQQTTLDQTGSRWGNYQSPQHCRECHQEEFQAWSNTTHAKASFDPIFQTYLEQVEQPGECFTCHATGYDTNTGQFVLAGVTCEACHGPYRAEHPRESMMIAASADLCGNCHASTLVEWQSSRHGSVGVNCIDCHEVHTQQTRAAAATNAPCATCHEKQIQDQTHAQHSQADVHCIDCHLARPDNNGSRAVSGHAITGHSFAVFVKTCTACHDNSLISE